MKLLHLDDTDTLHMDTSTFVGTSVAALGMTGSGKTNTVAVLIEEMLKEGLTMTIVDIEGEYWGLKEKFDLLIAGRSEHAELEIGPENAAQLAEVSLQRGISVILDLSDYDEEETYAILLAYFTRLWLLEKKLRKPYLIVLEEAHEFIPQNRATPLKTILARIASRGRKRGLSVILATQRSQKAEKDVLTQAAISFLHFVAHPTDMRVYKEIIPRPSAEVEAMVNALKPGDALVVFERNVYPVHMRLRDTFHVGSTPEFELAAEPELRKIDTAMLKELQALMLHSQPQPEGEKEARQANKRIAELEKLLAERDASIVALQERIETLNSSKASNHQNHQVEHNVPPLNEKKFLAFKRRLESVSALHVQMLHLLTEKDTSMPVREIAAWLNRSESFVQNNPPQELITMKLMGRMRETKGYYYYSLLRGYLEKEFPGASVEELITHLF